MSSNNTDTLSFYTGQKIPAIGLGTWQSPEDEVYVAVLTALKAGYRHIDTAAVYGNEVPVGKAIKASGVPREQIFVTTKLWLTHFMNVEGALQESLKKLDLQYVDLYLMHWPVAFNPAGNDPIKPTKPNGQVDILDNWDYIKTYQEMQPLVERGLTKAIGVSNFSTKKLEALLAAETTKMKPVVNQVEMHPYLPQVKLFNYCKDNDILVEAYSPLGSTNSPLMSDEVLTQIAEKHNVLPATVAISWAIWRGTVVLPKSVTPLRVQSNLKTLKLSDEEGEAINQIHKRITRRFVNPDFSPFVLWDDDE